MVRSRGALRGACGLLAGAAVLLVTSPPAGAACHAFTVDVSPTEVRAGETVTVTVSRDAAVNPSSVRARTIDETAVAGRDYEAVDRRIEFTTDTQQTFSIQTHPNVGQPRTFRVELSEGSGCPVNPNFTYDEATVRIVNGDGATTTAVPTTQPATTTTAATTTPSADDADTTSTEPAPVTSAPPADEGPDTTTTTTTTEDDELAVSGGDADANNGGAVAAILAAVLVVLAAAGAFGYRLYRARAQAS